MAAWLESCAAVTLGVEVLVNWQIWSTTHPHLVDIDRASHTSPESAIRAACVWNLDADGGFWFAGGVATVAVQSPSGERWTCAATVVGAAERVCLTPLVALAGVA